MRVVLGLIGLALVAPGCKRERLVGTASAAIAIAPPPLVAPVDAGAPALAAIDPAKIAPFEVDRSAITAEVPQVVDARGSLNPFYDRVLELARGPGNARRHVRIGVYGDSNLTSDHLTGHLRRALQARFGDGGHGFVALARPWPWYAHEDIRHGGTWPLFKQIAVTTDPIAGNRYGLASIAAESSTGGAAAWVATAKAGPIGTRASRFEVYFLRQPHGGSFDLVLDGKIVRTVSSASETIEPGYEVVETTDESHELRCVVKGDNKVRFFGTTVERDPPSIVVDSLGVGAMNFQRFMMGEPTLRRAHLQHRDYDLVVVWLGMNAMWLPPNRAWVAETIAALREGRPDLPVLLMSPPDSVKMGERKTDPRIVGLVTQLREVAEESGAAFWDFRAAMGGEASYLDFMKRGLAANDRAHLSQQGSALMGQRFLSALFDGVRARGGYR